MTEKDIKPYQRFSDGPLAYQTVDPVNDKPDSKWYVRQDRSGQKTFRGTVALTTMSAKRIIELLEQANAAKLRKKQSSSKTGHPGRDRMVIKCNPARFNAT